MGHAELQRDAFDCVMALAWRMRGRRGIVGLTLPSTGKRVLAGWHVATSNPGQIALFTCSYNGVDMRWRPRLLSRARFDVAAADFIDHFDEIARQVQRRLPALDGPRGRTPLGL